MGIVTEGGFYDGKFLKSGQFHKAEVEDVETQVGTPSGSGGQIDLDTMSKDGLLAEAEKRGVDVKANATKADIIAAIKAAA